MSEPMRLHHHREDEPAHLLQRALRLQAQGGLGYECSDFLIDIAAYLAASSPPEREGVVERGLLWEAKKLLDALRLGKSIHNERTPSKPVEGPLWDEIGPLVQRITDALATPILDTPAKPKGAGESGKVLANSEIRAWIEACNYEPARATLRELLRFRATPSAPSGEPVLPYAFITCNSNAPDYFVTIKTQTLRDAQAWHDAVLKLAAPKKQEGTI